MDINGVRKKKGLIMHKRSKVLECFSTREAVMAKITLGFEKVRADVFLKLIISKIP